MRPVDRPNEEPIHVRPVDRPDEEPIHVRPVDRPDEEPIHIDRIVPCTVCLNSLMSLNWLRRRGRKRSRTLPPEVN